MNRSGGMSRFFMSLMMLAALMMVFGGCIVRTNARTGKSRHGVRHAHKHCHNKKVKRSHKHRDHRKKSKRVCHRHTHKHPHH